MGSPTPSHQLPGILKHYRIILFRESRLPSVILLRSDQGRKQWMISWETHHGSCLSRRPHTASDQDAMTYRDNAVLIFRRARLDKSFSAPLSSTPWLNERPGESGWHTGTAMCEATRPHKDQLCFPFIHIIEIDISMWFYALWLSFYWGTREINNSHFETIVRHLHSLYSGYYIIYNYW